jgi:3D (Asp-Asp-Asp) domain-containing protein
MRLVKLAVLLLVAALLWCDCVNRAEAQDGTKRVTLHLANDVIPLDSKATTVGGFLAELSLALPPEAAPNPPPDAALQDGMAIYLQAISITRGETEQPIMPQVKIDESWHYGPDSVVLADPGQAGLVRTTCTIFYYGAQEVGRRQHEEVLREMQPQRVVCYRELTSEDGPSKEDILSKRVAPSADAPAPKRYKRIVTMESTAYEPGPTSCGNSSGNTAIGLQAGYGVVAVDPGVIELGTRLFIEGYGYAVAGDTGGAIKGNIIDLCFETLDECYKWGRREVKVYVLY